MNLKRILAGTLSVVAVSTLFFSPNNSATAYEKDLTIRVGLYYGSSVLPSANLENAVGGGYDFGYFNDNQVFHSVGNTTNTTVTVMKDKNMYLGSDNLYYDTKVSSVKETIGAYHFEVNYDFPTYEEALTYANNIENVGYEAFPAYIDGKYRVRIGDYTSVDSANSDMANVSAMLSGSTVTIIGGSATCYTVTETKSDEILFEFDVDNENLGIMPQSNVGQAETWFKGFTYFGGFDYNRRNGDDITVVNMVDMEDYVKGVITWEMSANWHLEALKAQALCARSYAYSALGKHESDGFDVCNTTHCQVYRGTKNATDNSDRAVEETAGQFITHDGKIIDAVFHSSDGGATEDSENVWLYEIPYLRAVIDNFEDLENAYNGIWEQTISNSQITSILKAKGYSVNSVVNMYIDEFTDVGNVYRLTIVDSSGKEFNFEKEEVRTILNSSTYGVSINSMRYNIGGEPGAGITPDAPDVAPPQDPEPPIEGGGYTGDIFINGQASTDSTFYVLGENGVSTIADVHSAYAATENGTQQIAKTTTVSASNQAASNGTYTINGQGWGHNVGMSQYGAKGMAELGYSYDDILKFYYTGVDITLAN